MAINDYFNTDTQEEKKKTTKMSSGVNSYFDVSETVEQPKIDSAKTVIETTAEETRVPTSAPLVAPVQEKSKVGKFLSAAFGKVKDLLTPSQKSQDAEFAMKQLMYGKNELVVDPVTGQKRLTNPVAEAYKNAKTPEEKAAIAQAEDAKAPLIKFLNSPTGAKITGYVADKTSDIPLKVIAKFKAVGDDILDGNIGALYKDVKNFGTDGSENYDKRLAEQLAKKNDPTNTRTENILYGVQDSGIQSAIGALLAIGVSALTRNPKAGQAVSLPYFAAISAEGQREEKGSVYSGTNIAIDTIGDSVIGGFAENALKSIIKEGGETAFKETVKTLGKGFLVEGTTEPTQTMLKYANDYKNAKTDAERQAVVAQVTSYVKDGGMVDEFLIGGISGAGITGSAMVAGKASSGGRPEVNVDETKTGGGSVSQETPEERKTTSESNVDFSAARDEAQTLQQHLRENPNDENAQVRLSALQDSLTDYQTVVKKRPVFIVDSVEKEPIAMVETVQYPDGKFTFSVNADTGSNSLQSPFVEGSEYKTEKQAIEAGKKAISEWATAQLENADPAEAIKLKEIIDELKADIGMQEKASKKSENKGQKTEEKPLAQSNIQEKAPLTTKAKPIVNRLSTNVTKAPVGYNVQEYSREGERVGKKKVRFERSKKTGKTSLVVYNEDGTRVSKTPVERLKKQFGTTDKAKLADYAVNGKLDTKTGKYTLNQSNAPVSKPTPKQIEKKPVVTKGEVKNSRAFSRVQERLGEFADTDVNYNKLNLAKDTANAIEFVAQYPKEAKKIALGMMSAPEGITETAISIALAEKASENGDYALQAQLERSRSLRQTRRGQEIVSERGRFNENSPHFFIQQVLQARMEQASRPKFRFAVKKGGKEGRAQQTGVKIEQGAENVKRTVKAKLSPVELAQDIINELTC